MYKPSVVCIKWVDAVASNGWAKHGKSERPMLCTSIGFIDCEDEEQITVAATFSGNETNNRISIPKGWIKSRREVTL